MVVEEVFLIEVDLVTVAPHLQLLKHGRLDMDIGALVMLIIALYIDPKEEMIMLVQLLE